MLQWSFNSTGMHVLSFASHFEMFSMFCFRQVLSEPPLC